MEDNRNLMFDAMILCDDHDIENSDVLLPFEEIELEGKLSFCYVYDGKEPGVDFTKYVSEMKDKVKCVVFYVTNNYCENEHLMRITRALAKCKKDLICVLKVSNIDLQKHLYFLTGTIIYQSEGNWQQNLQQKVNESVAQYPLFCKKIASRTFSGDLFKIGLDTFSLKWDVYGIIVQISEQRLEIDLERFIEHLEHHELFKTHQVCASCSSLCTLDTSVVLVLDNKTDVFNVPGFSEAFANLSSAVLDVIQCDTKDTIWTLLCTEEGAPLDKPETINKLRQCVLNALVNKCQNNREGRYYYPEYTDLQLRKESFSGKWSHVGFPTIDDVASAGFFYSEHTKNATCFQCGAIVFNWNANDDPCVLHAYTCPTCPYVTSIMTEEQKENEKELQKHRHGENNYVSVESRIKSFETFDINQLKNPEDIENRDSVIKTISEAGFHYLGVADIVDCPFCGLRLSAYEPDDTLNIVHVKLSPKCKFVLQTHGKSGIDAILKTIKLEQKKSPKNKERTAISMHIRTSHPKRDLPSNLFRPPSISQ